MGTADLIILAAYAMFNVQLLLLSKIGQPYDPVANTGVIGRNFTHQCMSSIDGFFDKSKFNFNPASSACHQIDGKGVANLFPALAGSSQARSDDPATAIRVVLRGARSVATKDEPTGPGMPSFAWQFTDDQVAAVVTYIRNAWGFAASAVSADTVSKSRKDLAQRSD
jgi:Cytochrome c